MISFLGCISIAFALLGAPLSSAEAYFCIKSGTRLEYERSYVSSSKLKWRHTMEIGERQPAEDGHLLEYSSSFHKPSGAMMYGGPVKLVARIGRSGDVTLDLAASLASVFSNYVGPKSLSYEPCCSVLPADMKVGDKLEDAYFEVAVLNFRFRVSVADRIVLRKETITTPAGEFECMVVREHKIEKGPGRNRETTALTWYAKNVGMVRHDTYDKNGKLETTELLVSK